MNKFFASTLALLILSASFLLCSQNNSEPINTENTTDAAPISPYKYKSKMDVDNYMQILVNYFHEPYKVGDDLLDKNLISLSFLFALSNKDNLDCVNVDEQNQNMYINGEGLRMVAKNLFGNNILLSDFHHYLEDFPDVYVEEQDKYIVLYARGYWGGDSYYLDTTEELQIMENDNTLTVTVNVEYIPQFGETESVQTMSYTFDKIVENDFLFYRINNIEVAK